MAATEGAGAAAGAGAGRAPAPETAAAREAMSPGCLVSAWGGAGGAGEAAAVEPEATAATPATADCARISCIISPNCEAIWLTCADSLATDAADAKTGVPGRAGELRGGVAGEAPDRGGCSDAPAVVGRVAPAAAPEPAPVATGVT